MAVKRMILAAGLAAIATFPARAANTGTLSTLYTFTGAADGSVPGGNLIYYGNNLYGTAAGGSSDHGVVFSVDTATGAEIVLDSFAKSSKGIYPGGLAHHAGKLYGFTSNGGSPNCRRGCGTIFRIDLTSGHTTTLYHFTGGADGGNPRGGLIYANGVLFGMAARVAGSAFHGSVFAIDPVTGGLTVIWNFPTSSEGREPSGLIYENGMLYGTTTYGGKSNFGTVFAVDPSTKVGTVLYSFASSGDGRYPTGALVDVDGTLFGATSLEGATPSFGAVFAFNLATGAETIRHTFSSGEPGDQFVYHLGRIYGFTYGFNDRGGSNEAVLFKIKPASGHEQELYPIGYGDGTNPSGLMYNSGAFYGATGVYNGSCPGICGSVFKYTP